MKIKIQLKYLISFFYTALAIIWGGLFLFSMLESAGGPLWILLLKANTPQAFSSHPWLVVVLIFTFSFVVLSGRFGFRRGVVLTEKLGFDKIPRPLVWGVCVAVLLLIGFFVLVGLNVAGQVSDVRRVSSSFVRVADMRIVQAGTDLVTSVKIKGRSKDQYTLEVLYRASSYVEGDLHSIKSVIPLENDIQIIDVKLPFKRLGELYREALKDYVPGFDREYLFDEFIDIVAVLRLEEHRFLSTEMIERLGLGNSQLKAETHFMFKCDSVSCAVDQEEKDTPDDPQAAVPQEQRAWEFKDKEKDQQLERLKKDIENSI